MLGSLVGCKQAPESASGCSSILTTLEAARPFSSSSRLSSDSARDWRRCSAAFCTGVAAVVISTTVKGLVRCSCLKGNLAAVV